MSKARACLGRSRALEPGHHRRPGSSDRVTAITFYAVELVAFPFLLAAGRNAWFTVDDWDFVARRTPGSLQGLFRAHFGHWVTLPFLVYRALWPTAGLHYTPYQAVAIVLHLVAVALLRAVMLRSGSRPWLATAGAVMLLAFGYGAENVLVAFQMTFVGALTLGLAYLLLADHDGPFDRHDTLGIIAGFGSLLCSGVGIAMIVVVGLAIWWRRGWHIALAHVVPLALAYLVWYFTFGRHGNPSARFDTNVGTAIRFMFIGATATFARLGHVIAVGFLLLAVLVIGLSLLRRAARHNEHASHGAAAPLALACGALFFLLLTAIGRSGQVVIAGHAVNVATLGPERARQSRYVYMLAALLLPAIVLACEEIVRRWRYAAFPLLALLVVGLPGNVQQFTTYVHGQENAFQRSVRVVVLRTPRLAIAQTLPRSLQPEPDWAPGVTVGWLLDSLQNGLLPLPPQGSGPDVLTLTLRLALRPASGSHRHCEVLTHPLTKTLVAGITFEVRRGSVALVYLPGTHHSSLRQVITGDAARVAIAGPLRLQFTPLREPHDSAKPTLCI